MKKQNQKIEPTSITYRFGSINGFKDITITMVSEKNYVIGYEFTYGAWMNLAQTKHGTIGNWQLFKDFDNYRDNKEFFETYEECVEIIKHQTPKKLINRNKKDSERSNRLMLEVVKQALVNSPELLLPKKKRKTSLAREFQKDMDECLKPELDKYRHLNTKTKGQ